MSEDSYYAHRLRIRIAQIGIPVGVVATLSNIPPTDLSGCLTGRIAFGTERRNRVEATLASVEKLVAAFGDVPIDLRDSNKVRSLIERLGMAATC